MYQQDLGGRLLSGNALERFPQFLIEGFNIAHTSASADLEKYAEYFRTQPLAFKSPAAVAEDDWWNELRVASFPAPSVGRLHFQGHLTA